MVHTIGHVLISTLHSLSVAVCFLCVSNIKLHDSTAVNCVFPEHSFPGVCSARRTCVCDKGSHFPQLS